MQPLQQKHLFQNEVGEKREIIIFYDLKAVVPWF